MTFKTISIVLLISSIVCFLLGMYFPILSTKMEVLNFEFKKNDIRLMDTVSLFYRNGEYFLGTIIFVFTVLLPIVKYLEIINRRINMVNFSNKVQELLHKLDKWSMLDVFIIAILLLNFKMNSIFMVMDLKIGTTLLAASILIRMIAGNLVKLRIKNEIIK